MRGPIGPGPARVHQRAGIALVRRGPARPMRIHRGIIRIRDDDLVPQGLEMRGDPRTLRRGFEQNAGPRPTPEQRGESGLAGGNAKLAQRAVLVAEAELALALVQIESCYPWLASRACAPSRNGERVKYVWSGRLLPRTRGGPATASYQLDFARDDNLRKWLFQETSSLRTRLNSVATDSTWLTACRAVRRNLGEGRCGPTLDPPCRNGCRTCD